MLEILRNRTYRHLFGAQLIALVGTGLATVALALLAYELAGEQAGAVLGIALAIKMIAYISVAPIAGALADRVPRKGLLVAMDLVRAAVALSLPFVDSVWQIYLLIFLLQSASATFTPAFQAAIPEVLPDERQYTRALSLSRLAYDMESLTSPALAAVLLTVVSFHWLFAGTAVGFLVSAVLVVTSALPKLVSKARKGGMYERTTLGARIFLRTPRLRGLLAVTLAAAAASAMVIVNTVVIVRGIGLSQRDVAWALAAYGGGSMAAALLLPRLLDRLPERQVMIAAAAALTGGLIIMAAVAAGSPPAERYWQVLLAGWAILGIAYSIAVTPSGRLLRRSSNAEDRAALFAAQFALSHACWLVCYPLAGQLGAQVGMPAAFAAMAALAAIGTAAALRLWPRHDPPAVPHRHDDLSPSHPHWEEHRGEPHVFVIDELHPTWPRS